MGLSLVVASEGVSCCRARALGCIGFSSCGAWAQWLQLPDPRTQAQWLWLTSFVAPWHVGSSRTRDQTLVSCIGRQILDHWATRGAPGRFSYSEFFHICGWLACYFGWSRMAVRFLLIPYQSCSWSFISFFFQRTLINSVCWGAGWQSQLCNLTEWPWTDSLSITESQFPCL